MRHDRLYTGKGTLINGWGNVPLQKEKKKSRGHHYLRVDDNAADRETVKGEVKTQLNFLLITETLHRLKDSQ